MNGQSRPVSGQQFEVKLDRRVRMPMSDGVELAAVVARPDAPGEFPAIVEYHPLPPVEPHRGRRIRKRL